MLAPSRGWRPLLRGILYPPLYGNIAVHVGSYSEEMGPSNWTRANTMCSDLGMRLLTIDSPEEESLVVENISLSNEYVCDLSRYENSLLFFTVFHYAVADPRGGHARRPPPSTDQNFLNFMQFLGKSGKFVWLAPPPTGNPGSAPVMINNYLDYSYSEEMKNVSKL